MLKSKIIFLLIIIYLSTSTSVFGFEEKIPLPSDKFPLVWKIEEYDLHWTGYVDGDYTDEVGNQYSVRVYSDSQRVKAEVFAKKIYELFGFTTLPHYIVEANKISKSNISQNERLAIITKVPRNLKPLDKFLPADLTDIQEQLAQLHLVSALIGNHFYFPNEEKLDCGIFIKEGKIYINHTSNIFGYCTDFEGDFEKENYTKTVATFKELLQPQDNWHAAMVFQEPFKNHILRNPQKFIAWLESAWDENKIDVLFKESGLENLEILANLKSRFQDLKKQLVEVDIKNYEFYTSGKIKKIIAERSKGGSHAYKNVYYEFKEILPRVEEQMFICTDGNKVWLELTNYEFLINGKKSNRIVKIYIGDISGNEVLNPTEKYSLQIFDPETAFVFMKAILGCWDTINHNPSSSVSNLAQVLQVGYQEVLHHFNLVDSTENTKIVDKISSFKELVGFWQLFHESYAAKVQWIGRLITIEDIEKRKAQGFDAYYPNPAYLDDVAIYKRPYDMGYEVYVEKNNKYLKSGSDHDANGCQKNYLMKNSDIKLDYCDEYNSVLEKIYPDDVTYLNDTHKFHFSDFKRAKNIYGFRGEERTVDEIYASEGIWPRGYTYGKPYLAKTDRKMLLENKSIWKINVSEDDGSLHHGLGPYISTSKIIDVTKIYGKNVYVILTDGGLILPADNNGEKVDDDDLMEIAIPGGVEWKNVIGERDRANLSDDYRDSRSKYLFGPIYLKQSLIKDDPQNFWEILQLLGGKPQCEDNGFVSDLTDSCVSFWGDISRGNADKIINKLISHYQNDRNYQRIQDYLSKCNKISFLGNVCQKALYESLGSQNLQRR